jgi:hypothetical protein
MIKKHAMLAMCFAVFIVMLIIGRLINNNGLKQYNTALEQLNRVKNETITQTINTEQKQTVNYKQLVGGLDKNRWYNDDVIMSEWIYPAFTFSSVSEYNENRNTYVNRLGLANDFVVNVMPPYTEGLSSVSSDINMKIDRFTSYVDGISGDTYSYVAIVVCSSTKKDGSTGTSSVILTYSIDADGNVLNFHAATPYQAS